ncbi:MAG TPA: CHAD domain-containing protein [Nitrososphaeraceae archaeon]|nr:CHAD domain-containing protein [Nitrososphaeraceae archaeon]
MIKLHENLQRLDNKTSSYIKNSNEKNIHDIRTSVRRFNASFLTLPKRYRKEYGLSEYNQLANRFFKVNSEIRDIDIILGKLKEYPETIQKNNAIDLLKNERQSKLECARTFALTLKNVNSNKILDKIDITEKEIQKRYNKILTILINKIETNFLIVITNPIKVEELHALRKDCKKLRYLLEILGKEDNNAIRMVKTLQNIQDILGSIRDYDVTVEYLKKLEPSKEIQDIINNEIEQRRVKYEEFLIFARRRLHISKSSFFIRIKSFYLNK